MKAARRRNATLALGAALALGLTQPGAECGSEPCESVVQIQEQGAESGEVTWPDPGVTVSVDDEDSDPSCSVGFGLGGSSGTGDTALYIVKEDHLFVTGFLEVECVGEDDQGAALPLYYRLSLFTGDWRDWFNGAVAADDLEPSDPNYAPLTLWTMEGCDAAFDNDCTTCEYALPEATIAAEVIEAAGTAADFPDMVTFGFRRLVSFDIDTGQPVPEEGCSVAPPATVSLTVQLETEDFRPDSCHR